MVCYHILQPTRVTDNTSTVIDNIFSNILQDDIISGNILLTLSEHFSQYISVNREKIDLKKINVYQRDYSRFSNESFRDDVFIQIWNNAHENVHNLFNDFYSKLERSVNRHAPLRSSPKEIKIKNKPWLNTIILKMIKIRNKVFHCKRLYNLLRKRITRELKKSKNNITRTTSMNMSTT